MNKFDAMMWRSGIHCLGIFRNLMKCAKYVKYDSGAVRVTITNFLLHSTGYRTNGVYGDPAVLIPLFYRPITDKKYQVSSIAHLSTKENYRCTNV